ncbi:MAG: hypothetical protein JEZ02_08865 [Desulfatibacillum sp.]|nr:hypothetical protein [Desulfatibacillum sp.]
MDSKKALIKKCLIALVVGVVGLAGILIWAPKTHHHSIAFVCFAICATGFFVAGCVYFFTPKFLPYHQQASDMDWEELTPQSRGMALAVLRIVAGGFLCASVATFILLWIPYRQGLVWAGPAIFVIYNSMAIPALYGTYLVASNTPSNPPLLPVLTAIIISFVGMILSF